ncbi:hypothetical protein CEE37_06690 [candidate division LCP-89 bacterium B3_LCP]|uniref:Gingipain R n=1 Tax=candidate division LCP-89 bacterium B3_LCP TaxID=2012998 RepID=A0A532V0A5_UNCL8|nr:MAG: hypothetical protein CEE37_06690 [candidate division LCP-89 bacterium B3_LCP]
MDKFSIEDEMMRSYSFFICLGILVFGIITVNAETVYLRSDVTGDRPQISIIESTASQIQWEILLPEIEISNEYLDGRSWDRIRIAGGSYGIETGAPEIPAFNRLLAIPGGSGVRVEFEMLESSTLNDIELIPVQDPDPTEQTQLNLAVYSQDAFYPQEQVSAGPPAIMRGIRLSPIQMNPVSYNPVTKKLRIAHKFRVTAHFEGADSRNATTRPPRPISRSWKKLMDSLVLNAGELDLDLVEVGSYLVICENDNGLVNGLLPLLLDWKQRKGHTVVLETFNPGSSQPTIKAIIQNAYDNWDIPPEFVLLFGDTNGSYALPAGAMVSGSYGIDHPYSMLDGGDLLPDAAVGRIPAYDDYEAAVMRNKVLYYEKLPFTTHDEWYHQGCLIAGSSWSGLSTILTNRWIKDRMVQREYTRIDTFWFSMGSPGVAQTINNAVNDGVSYLNYRGYLGMENFDLNDIDNFTNGRMMPFVTTLTCGSGGFKTSGISFMEKFMVVGTPSTPKGAIAAVGTATSGTATRYNNTVAVGIYAGIFDEGITQAGNALNRGKIEIYNAYINFNYSAVENYCYWNALAGDPGLELFTSAIQYLECDVPDTMPLGENSLSLTVNEPGIGPVEEAVVCLYKEGEIHDVRLTDASGQVTIPLNASATGNVKVTVTKQNYYPIVDSLDVVQEEVAVGYYDHTIDDDNTGSSFGDGDGIINPGETLEIPLVLSNFGNTITATTVSVNANVIDDYATLDDDYETFPNIAPGGTANSSDDLDLTISEDCPNGHIVSLDIVVNGDQGSWNSLVDLEVVSYEIKVSYAYTAGADSLLSPGETADFLLTIRNWGDKDAESLTATMTSLNPWVTVNDNTASFGTVNIGDPTTCTNDPFNLTALADSPPGHPAEFEVVFASATGALQIDTLTIELGIKTTADPQGPDNYGYYCFDNTDLNYAQAPLYDWIEIDPHYGGSGTQLPINDTYEEDDMSVVVSLPFTFTYYGEDTDSITVCSNGWISTTPNAAYANFTNYPIPSSMSPNGIIAAFWDDLITTGGHICSWEDVDNHSFIIEWSRVKNRGTPQPEETFQIILYDPVYHQTPTGDGPILFQYQSITEVNGPYYDNPYSTVGIEKPDHSDGIEIVYWAYYSDPAAAQLQNSRAYYFTTALDYSLPGNDLYVTLTPVGAPIVIPSSGGIFDFNIEAGNNSANPASADIWCDVILPNGSTYGPTLGPVLGFPFLANWSTNRDRSQAVPGGAPAGDYTYNAYVGTYPGTVYNQDSFDFQKSGEDGSEDWTSGWFNYGEPFFAGESVKANQVLPDEFSINGVYPNPFNPTVTIAFALPHTAKVKLTVFDIQGRVLATLVEGMREAGIHEVTWNATGMASGLYFCRMQSGAFSATQKMMLVK